MAFFLYFLSKSCVSYLRLRDPMCLDFYRSMPMYVMTVLRDAYCILHLFARRFCALMQLLLPYLQKAIHAFIRERPALKVFANLADEWSCHLPIMNVATWTYSRLLRRRDIWSLSRQCELSRNGSALRI